MPDYKLGFFGEEIDLKLQQIEELRGGGIEQLQQNNATITQAIERINIAIEALQNASTGAVRHIQRGVITSSSSKEQTISLSGFTNVDKMIVLLDGAKGASSGFSSEFFPSVLSLTVDSLTTYSFSYSNNTNFKYSYQVIEFY